MPNYIQTLQNQNKELNDRLNSVNNTITEFLVYLNSPKFQSNDTERKDWISTNEVENFLKKIRLI